MLYASSNEKWPDDFHCAHECRDTINPTSMDIWIHLLTQYSIIISICRTDHVLYWTNGLACFTARYIFIFTCNLCPSSSNIFRLEVGNANIVYYPNWFVYVSLLFITIRVWISNVSFVVKTIYILHRANLCDQNVTIYFTVVAYHTCKSKILIIIQSESVNAK